MLNTGFFLKHNFQYADPESGYFPKAQTYIYGLENGAFDITNTKRSQCIYLGGQINQKGDKIGNQTWNTYSKDKSQWGNVFNVSYFDFELTSFISTEAPSTFFKNPTTQNIGSVQVKQTPYYLDCRYNPYKDKGTGNIAYWLQVSDATMKNGIHIQIQT